MRSGRGGCPARNSHRLRLDLIKGLPCLPVEFLPPRCFWECRVGQRQSGEEAAAFHLFPGIGLSTPQASNAKYHHPPAGGVQTRVMIGAESLETKPPPAFVGKSFC